jgi:hypothetical protein
MNYYFIFSNLITSSKSYSIIILFYFLIQHFFLISFQLWIYEVGVISIALHANPKNTKLNVDQPNDKKKTFNSIYLLIII